MKKKQIKYSESILEIEKILQKIENNEADIDELSEMVAKATELIEICKNKLHQAENDIDKILKSNN